MPASNGPTGFEDTQMIIKHGFHAAMTAHPGKGDALVALLRRAPSLNNDDCAVFLIGRSASNPDLVFVTEGWSSKEAHGRFFGSDVAKAYTAEFGPLVVDTSYADEVPLGGKAAL
jgi:quinol monooxygenase YgiN